MAAHKHPNGLTLKQESGEPLVIKQWHAAVFVAGAAALGSLFWAGLMWLLVSFGGYHDNVPLSWGL